MGTVLTFRGDGRQPRAEIALGNGDRVAVEIDGGGLTIKQIGGGDSGILFQADRDLVGHICAGLVESGNRLDATPLTIVVAAVLQIHSAEQVRAAFNAAATQIS